MRLAIISVIGALGLLGLSGCRTATRLTEMPRVDLELSGGNRGYVVGTPPTAAELKPTREMIQTDIEVPSFYKPQRTGRPVDLDQIAPPEMETDAALKTQVPTPYDTYVVQKGDSLWSIAAKPEIYGKASRWRSLYEANRDLLKSPDQLKAGMTLKIPRDEAGGSTTYTDEGITYKK